MILHILNLLSAETMLYSIFQATQKEWVFTYKYQITNHGRDEANEPSRFHVEFACPGD